jgi:DNA repair photolyase
MADIVFEEIECRSALQRVQAANLPFRWALNPYRMDVQRCGRCADAEGDARVVVRVNAAEALRGELERPGWRREIVAIGTACEPYHSAELRYSLTHRVLKTLRDAANPTMLFTRSSLVVRDSDILVDISRVADVSIVFPMCTLDEDVRRLVEPASEPVDRRLRAMEQLATAGVRCGLLLAPVSPGLTDAPSALDGVAEAAREHGASFLHPNVLYLRPGTREWSMPLLRDAYPHLAERYAAYYPGPHGVGTFTQDVHRTVDRLRERFGFGQAAESCRAAGQLQLAI